MSMAAKRIIDAAPVISKLAERALQAKGMECSLLGWVIDLLHIAPAVELVKRGRWEPREDVPGFVRCSVCHDCNIYDEWPDGKKWRYCPQCGALLDGGDEQ
jgi:hypothetical protein